MIEDMSLKRSSSSRFLFRGNSASFSARLHMIAGQARSEIVGLPAASLTVAGGESRAKAGKGNYHDVFSWRSALCHSVGEAVGRNSFVTRTHAEIRSFTANNKPHIFSAGDILVTMMAEHSANAQTRFTATNLTFGGKPGLVLDGSPITLEYDDDISQYPDFLSFEAAYRKNKSFFAKHQFNIGKAAADARFGSKLPRNGAGYVVTSLLSSVTWNGKTYPGNSLALKGFGRLHFGELALNESNRRLTMVRLSLGCDNEGEGGIGEVDPNGSWG
ncbi:hypothetical protein QQ054_34045 [Oscillatoria amoena NRMC-F 0135]|nr:hypothetical protein [Oscillatoria amoena NRMC-F 0135]